ncbi:MAG TPA: DinB family protein [Fimbriimonadaceae bacterium]|nr:DinB family protein [Fimbriimonadaceae bacterium]
MEPSFALSVESLSRTPDVLESTVLHRPEEWLDLRHASDVLSPREVVGHLAQGEIEDWIPRARIILEAGESQTFTPFDRYKFQEKSHATPIEELLAEFRRLRAANVDALMAMNLTEDDLDRRGVHPAHGPVTLRNLVHTWAAHDLYHLGQVYKSFSVFYLDKIGAWQGSLNLPHFN